jgi:hypothetical protein
MCVAALIAVGGAGAKSPVRRAGVSSCPAGYKTVTKVTRKHGVRSVTRICRKKAAAATEPATTAPSPGPTADSGPAPTGVPAAPAPTQVPPAPVEGEGTEPPVEPPSTPPTEPPAGPTSEPEIHAAIGAGFRQNPLVPNEVTWHYSASATRTVTSEGTPHTESVPLPEGVIAFFVDGKLECEINAGGAIAGSACTVDLQQLGAHEVETIFSGGALSGTASRTDYIGRYPTSTNLQVSVEPTAPEYVDIGPNAYGFEQYGFEVGRLRITGSITPDGYPTFDCEGQPIGCLDPEVTLGRSHNGSVSLPLFAQFRLNSATGREEWHVAFHAYNPTAREYGDFWQFPEESVGKQFFHAVAEPDPRLYEPSSITVPLDLNGGHYPFYRWYKSGEAGGSVAAVEGTMRPAFVLGTYDKFDGTEANLKFNGRFYGAAGEYEGCIYQPRADGQGLGERRSPHDGSIFDFLNGFPGLTAGLHTLELWVERKAGAGPGNCALSSGTFEAYEVVH